MSRPRTDFDSAALPADQARSEIGPATLVILTAREEADRIEATIAALQSAFPGAPVWVADDGSTDATASIAARAGATVVRAGRPLGKGGAATLAVQAALKEHGEQEGVAVLCDGDLGESARLLVPLAEAVRDDRCDLAVAAFAQRVGGGFGVALGFAGWAIRRRCGLRLNAPISGQRAIRLQALAGLLPFADGFGMELGMTIDAARAGLRVAELGLDLSHRATGRTFGGFLHRGRQLLDIARAYLARR